MGDSIQLPQKNDSEPLSPPDGRNALQRGNPGTDDFHAKLVRVVISDDHRIVREGLKALFDSTEIDVVGEVERADQIKDTVVATQCDVLLLDLQLDRWVMDDIPELASLTRIVVLTGSDSDDDAASALRKGARAIVQKTYAVDTVKQAIRAVLEDSIWLPPGLQDRLAARSAEGENGKALTARETEIVRSVAMGMRNAEVAKTLAITEGTVKIHLNNIFKKLNIRDRVELTLYAIRNRLIPARGSGSNGPGRSGNATL